MKAKLLKKLRKRYRLQERNGKLRLRVVYGSFYGWTDWYEPSMAIEMRRNVILMDASSYAFPKKNIKP